MTFCKDAYEATADADCLVITTEWDEFKSLDFDRVKAGMSHPTIVDGRNLLNPAAMRKMGFTYRSVGRA